MEKTDQHETSAEVDERYPNTPIGIVRSREVFLRDLPALLTNPKYDRWCVAYCGDERIALADSLTVVIRECERRGLHQDECYIGCIVPHSDEEVEEIDFGFFELDEIEDEGDEPASSGSGTTS
jgi:hypothetical protein